MTLEIGNQLGRVSTFSEALNSQRISRENAERANRLMAQSLANLEVLLAQELMYNTKRNDDAEEQTEKQ